MDYFKIKEFIRYRKKEIRLCTAAVFLFGIVLVAAGSIFMPDKQEVAISAKQVEEKSYDDNTEKKLEEILSHVEGAGKVSVMITYSQGSQKVAAQNTKEEKTVNGDEEKTGTETTFVFADKDDGEEPIFLTEYYPCVMGVVIVAQGGDNVYVKDALSRAAEALLDVPANKIEILKMEE